MIGKRALDDPRNVLAYYFVRLVANLKASYFVFENVRGLTVGTHRRFLDAIIIEFEKLGYDVVQQYRVLNASDQGVPQSRQRLFSAGGAQRIETSQLPTKKSRGKAPEQSWRFVYAGQRQLFGTHFET